MSSTRRGTPDRSEGTDRAIAVSRTIHGPRELVFAAFTSVQHLSRWWGPKGFTTRTRAFEFRVGGVWDFTMRGPDGTNYPEWITWTEITPPERIAMLHGEHRDDPDAFESVLTFAADGDRTTVELLAVFPTAELRDEAIKKHGAIEGGRQTLGHLEAYITGLTQDGAES